MAAPRDEALTDTDKQASRERWSAQLKQMLGYRPQSWLVTETGVDQTTVSRWFTGARAPNVQQLEKIAKAFGLTPAQLWAWSPANPTLPNEPAPKRGGSMLAQQKIPARVDAFLAMRPGWMSELEKDLFVKSVAVMSQSPGLDLTDTLLLALAKAIKLGYAASGAD